MDIPEFVVQVANPFFPLPDNAGTPLSSRTLESAVGFAVKNKVFPLFYEGCTKQRIQLPKQACSLMEGYMRRRRAQFEAAELLLDISEKHNIELLFFKTFRSFNYVPDDVDVLLRRRTDLELLINLLKKEGYGLLKIGTPEVVVRKIWNGTYVDIDIHKSIGAGHLRLLKTDKLWQDLAYVLVGEGYEVPTLSACYEVVREAAYSLLKDFMIPISGFYCAIDAIMEQDMEAVRRIAKDENLLPHVDLFIEVAREIAYQLFGFEADPLIPGRGNEWRMFMVSLPLIRAELRKRLKVPYPYPSLVIALAYFSKAWAQMQHDGDFGTLLQLLRQPSSKGIDGLLAYLRERRH